MTAGLPITKESGPFGKNILIVSEYRNNLQIHAMSGLYIHVPFCKQACHYCDFHFSTSHQGQLEMVLAMAKEITLQKKFLNAPLDSVYFGGGTPSLLNQELLDILIDALHANFSIHPTAEITLEANPDDLNNEKLVALRKSGINRLSIGIQSFDDVMLRYLNRAHDSKTAYACLHNAREAGFNNISLDLIYAIPGLSPDLWKETLQVALQFKPEHISSYGLTIENKTVFGNWMKKGKLLVVDDENAASQFEVLMDLLTGSGYDQYEISNFCMPGFYSRHNSSYWKQIPYLGIGPSAHSYDGTARFFNVRNNAQYVKSIGDGQVPFESELLTRENKINEYLLTGLRTRWGCNLEYLQKELGDDMITRSGPYLQQMFDQGLMLLDQKTIRLTQKGRLLADKITADLMT